MAAIRLCIAVKSHSPNKNEICIKRMTSILLFNLTSFAFLLVLLFKIDDFEKENISAPFTIKSGSPPFACKMLY